MSNPMSYSMLRGGRYWVQYHNYDKIGYPAGDILEEKPDLLLSEFTHSISTKKPWIKQTKDDTIFLIVGMTVNKKKKYFLWTKTIVEKVKPMDRDGIFDAVGKQWILEPPQLLNDKTGFVDFISKTANFSIGFQNISDWPFLNTLKKLSEDFRCQNVRKLTYREYIKNFEAGLSKAI